MIFFLKTKSPELKADLKQLKGLINEYDKYVLQNELKMRNKEPVTQVDLRKDAVSRLTMIINFAQTKSVLHLEEKMFRQTKEKYEQILAKLNKFLDAIDRAELENKVIEVRNG